MLPPLADVAPGPRLRDALMRFEHIGGVVEYALFRPSEEASLKNLPALHRAAAVAFVEGHNQNPYFSVTFEADKAQFQPITPSAFFGQPLAPHGAPRLCDSAGALAVDLNGEGYCHAFCHPPYSLQAKCAEIEELFTVINRGVLGDIWLLSEVYRWSSDWSNYFDAGNEWWGAYLWTVWVEQKNWIAVVGASTTD